MRPDFSLNIVDSIHHRPNSFRFFFKTTHDQPRRFKTTWMARNTTPAERKTYEGVLIDTSELKMKLRHFGIEDELSTGFFKLSMNGRQDYAPRGGLGEMSDHVYLSLLYLFALELAPLGAFGFFFKDVLLALSCQAFARFLLADLEQVLRSRRVVALWQVYVRSLPTCTSPLCCGPLLLFDSWSTIYSIIIAIAMAIAFQVNTGVSYLLDYGEDIYDGGPLCPV